MSAARKVIYHNLILLFVIGFAYLWSFGALNSYTLQFISLLTLLYIGFQIVSKKVAVLSKYKVETDITLLTFIIFLIIFYTGGLDSQLFFLLYFLLFGISMLFEPITALTLAFIASLFFVVSVESLWSSIFQIGSLFLITPLAIFFGTQYVELLKSNKKIVVLEGEIDYQEDVVDKWTHIDLKTELTKIWESLNKLSLSSELGEIEKNSLEEVKKHLNHILEKAKVMEKKIEE